MPRRKADILALPGVGPALGQILATVFNAWEHDDAADAAAAATAAATATSTGANHGDNGAGPNENDDRRGGGDREKSCEGSGGHVVGFRNGIHDSAEDDAEQDVLEGAAAAAAAGSRHACHHSREGQGDVVDCTGSDSDGEGRQVGCIR